MVEPSEPPAQPVTAEQIERWRAALRGGDRYNQLDAIEAAGQLGRAAAGLVPDIVLFLASSDYVPCTGREYEFSGHAPLAQSATSAIESIGVVPDFATLRTIMADHRLIMLPEASYDQGAYIGDYSSETIAPAGFAARLVELAGLGGFDLLDALAENALHEAKEIYWPAHRCIMRLAEKVAVATDEQRSRLLALTEAIEAMPVTTPPTTHHGFDLRDLARYCRKRLNAAR